MEHMGCFSIVSLLSRYHVTTLSALSLSEGVLTVLAHEIVDGLSEQGLDVGIRVESELVQRTADCRTEIADDRFLPVTWIARLRGRFWQSRF
jgi:hypothetical protein